MSADEHLLLRHDPCPWLPPGGVADVIATEWETPPHPTAVVRLLVTSAAGILVVPRPDGGSDLPSSRAGDDPVRTLALLQEGHAPTSKTPTLLGYVLNKVTEPTPDYPWPTPRAYFALWHCEIEPHDVRIGAWLPYERAEAELGQRHWWPLVRRLVRVV